VFAELKHFLAHAPVLSTPHTRPDSEFIVNTDASKYAIGAVLLQKDLISNEIRLFGYTAKMLIKARN
jgi:hypothetical protein